MKALNQVCEVTAKYSTKIKASDRAKIRNSNDSFNIFKEFYKNFEIEQKETSSVLLLTNSNSVLGVVKVAEGNATACVMDVQYILRCAILTNAQAIILCHNHPSGELKPSDADKQITLRISEASKLLNIRTLDHLIINEEGCFYSFADNWLI